MVSEPRSLFVTGTDTGVGKTLVSAALLLTLARHGRRAVGMKPVAAGLVERDGAFVSEDAAILSAASNVAVPGALSNPVALAEPVSPHLAAARAGCRVAVAELLAAHAALLQLADIVLVEGAGGWRVPLNERETLADMAIAVAAPVVLVVGLRLGCLNHALLTAEAVAADGLSLAGWVANVIDPEMTFLDENIATLRQRLSAPLLGIVPWSPLPVPADIALQLPPQWR